MARRLGDPVLLQDVLQATFSATWRPASAPRRLALAEEAAALGAATGDDARLATALTLQAIVLGEPGVRRPHVGRARAGPRAGRPAAPAVPAHRPGLPARPVARDARPRRRGRGAHRAGRRARAGVSLLVRLHQGDGPAVVAGLQALGQRSELPLTSVLCAVLLLVALAGVAREVLASSAVELDRDDWTALLTWCTACEVAAGLGLPQLGAGLRAGPALRRPCRGRRLQRADRAGRRLPRPRGSRRRRARDRAPARRRRRAAVPDVAGPAGRAVAAGPAGPARLLTQAYANACRVCRS